MDNPIECQGIYKQWPGQCCCHCKRQIKIMKHPWNKGEGKGRMSEVMGYGCLKVEEAIFFEKEHGMCECYDAATPKPSAPPTSPETPQPRPSIPIDELLP